ncbi:glycoside hydrolase family 13 protein [Microbacterium oryzae]|uniref:glycoside hydrolase family 13 protein n=1 Tax=Microbacterium oryzae TaxID=743009 RepID=UPI0025AF5771|nr:glycoside hydrolase family 13 protein [Microbacterium oryzae]MDN3310326.1 glycoside hydrolase family 13 protein [Microbacterium oryzae]
MITPDADWWRDAVVYQVYPRAFADTTGDGVGDLGGVRSRLPYLAALGVDAVWLSPFYPSALADGGYDVDDYCAVDPALGSLDDVDGILRDAHALGMRVIVDIVPNHSSDRHAWFRAALAAGPGSPERARYVFRQGRGEAGALPPNGWTSLFGGSAWHPVGDGTWYLHLFAPEQPDFDWSNPEVREMFHDVLRFWADRGVDGFRVDVAHGLAKDLSDPLPGSSSLSMGPVGSMDAAPPPRRADGTDPLFDRDEVHEIFAGWRRVLDEYDPPRSAVAEAWVPAHRRALYARPTELGQAFEFPLLESPWCAAAFAEAIRENLTLAASVGSSSTWVLSNHDVIRHTTRYGLPPGADAVAWLMSDGGDPREDRDRGLRRARAATQLILALPGSTYLYQGEELGLPEVPDIPRSALQDPIWVRSSGSRKGRDGSRVPLPWTSTGPRFGFGPERDGSATPLPQPSWFGTLSVEAQTDDPTSTIEFYRSALTERRRRFERAAMCSIVEHGEDVLEVRRSDGVRSLTNFGDVPVPLRLAPGEVVGLSSDPSAPIPGDRAPMLPGETTAWLFDNGAGVTHTYAADPQK